MQNANFVITHQFIKRPFVKTIEVQLNTHVWCNLDSKLDDGTCPCPVESNHCLDSSIPRKKGNHNHAQEPKTTFHGMRPVVLGGKSLHPLLIRIGVDFEFTMTEVADGRLHAGDELQPQVISPPRLVIAIGIPTEHSVLHVNVLHNEQPRQPHVGERVVPVPRERCLGTRSVAGVAVQPLTVPTALRLPAQVLIRALIELVNTPNQRTPRRRQRSSDVSSEDTE